ncbi:hypothetical protein ACFX2I_017110 [Malus domestica]
MAHMSRLNQLGRVIKLAGQSISDTTVEFNPFVFATFGVFRYVCRLRPSPFRSVRCSRRLRCPLRASVRSLRRIGLREEQGKEG